MSQSLDSDCITPEFRSNFPMTAELADRFPGELFGQDPSAVIDITPRLEVFSQVGVVIARDVLHPTFSQAMIDEAEGSFSDRGCDGRNAMLRAAYSNINDPDSARSTFARAYSEVFPHEPTEMKLVRVLSNRFIPRLNDNMVPHVDDLTVAPSILTADGGYMAIDDTTEVDAAAFEKRHENGLLWVIRFGLSDIVISDGTRVHRGYCEGAQRTSTLVSKISLTFNSL